MDYKMVQFGWFVTTWRVIPKMWSFILSYVPHLLIGKKHEQVIHKRYILMAKNHTEKKQKSSAWLWLHISVLRGSQFFPTPCIALSPQLPRNSIPGKKGCRCSTEIWSTLVLGLGVGVIFCVYDKKFKGSLGPMPFWSWVPDAVQWIWGYIPDEKHHHSSESK